MQLRVTTLLLLLLVVCACAATVHGADSDYVVRMVQVAHRHGARTPYVDENKTEVCGSPTSCGLLTEAGIEMLGAVGSYMRKRYNNPKLVGEAFFPSEIYDPLLVYSRSTSTERTLRSGASFLSSLFPNKGHFFPAIYTVNMTTDLVGITDAFPEVMVKRYVDQDGTERTLQHFVDKQFTWEQVRAMAADAYQADYCSNYDKRFDCCFKLYDILVSFEANGQLDPNSNLAKGRCGLEALWTAWNRYIFGFYPEDALNATQGTAGQFIANDMVKNIRSFIASPQYKMYHYSVHDVTVTPLAISLGDQSDVTMTPQYAVTMQVELLQKTDDSYHVRVLRGTPKMNSILQTYLFEPESFTMQCRKSTGEIYAPVDGICPLEDFVRYVDYTSANTENGYCQLPPKQLAMLNCPANRRSNSPMPKYCELYRTICPSAACPKDFFLNAVDMRCYPVGTTPAHEYEVILAQVVHRHGARGPNTGYNQSLICGTEYPCGELNGAGIDELRSIGSFMRKRYNDTSIVASPFFTSERYNSSLVYSRSTALQRTLQSATSFLHGLFPDGEDFYPVVYTVENMKDFLLNTIIMPPSMLRESLSSPEVDDILNPVVDEHFTFEELQAAAAEAYMGEACSNYEQRSKCALDVFDIATSFEAVGKLDDKRKLKAAMPGADAVRAAFNEYVLGYNATDELRMKQGTMAQNIAQEIVKNMVNYKPSSYRMFEYSTHDTIQVALAITFGDQSPEVYLPPYGLTFQVELLKDVGDGSHHVRVLRGSPQRQADGSYVFMQTPFTQRCMDETGHTYTVTNNVCPLEDFIRLVNATKPSVEYGYCDVDPVQYDRMECPLTVADGKPVPHYCSLYRNACPTKSCPEGCVLDANDQQCYKLNQVQNRGAASFARRAIREEVPRGPLAWRRVPEDPALVQRMAEREHVTLVYTEKL